MSKPDTTTRSALLASWEAARRQADQAGAIILNATSFAGFVLVQAGGLVPLAIELVPPADGSVFYARVVACLQSVEAEERAPGAASLASAPESAVRTC